MMINLFLPFHRILDRIDRVETVAQFREMRRQNQTVAKYANKWRQFLVRGKSLHLSKKSSRRGSKIKRTAGGDSENLDNLEDIKKQGDIIAKKFEQLLRKKGGNECPDDICVNANGNGITLSRTNYLDT